jgi:hypothetical protein
MSDAFVGLLPMTHHILHIYLPMKLEQTDYSEMLAYKFQTPANHPEDSSQHFLSNQSQLIQW